MIIVHASGEDGRLLVWGETPPSAPVARRSRKTSNPTTRFYPANAGAARVAETLSEAVPDAAPRGSPIETRVPLATYDQRSAHSLKSDHRPHTGYDNSAGSVALERHRITADE